jgi:hypothetical protein
MMLNLISPCLAFFVTAVVALPDNSIWRMSNTSSRLNSHLQAVAASLRQLYPQISQGKFNIWEMVQIAAACSLVPGFWYLKRKRKESKSMSWTSSEPSINDGITNGSAGAIRKSIDISGKSPSSSNLETGANSQSKHRQRSY